MAGTTPTLVEIRVGL